MSLLTLADVKDYSYRKNFLYSLFPIDELRGFFYTPETWKHRHTYLVYLEFTLGEYLVKKTSTNWLLSGALGLAMTAGTLFTATPKAEAGIKIRATVCPDKDVCITVGDNDRYYNRRRYRRSYYNDGYYNNRRYRSVRYDYPPYHIRHGGRGYFYWQGYRFHRDGYGNFYHVNY